MWCRHLQCQTRNNKKDNCVFPSALHPKTTKMFKHRQCETQFLPLKPSLRSPPASPKSDRNVVNANQPEQIRRWGSAWFLPLRPSLRSPPASPKSAKNVQASSMRNPPGQISRWGSARLFPSSHISHAASSSRNFTQIRQKFQAS